MNNINVMYAHHRVDVYAMKISATQIPYYDLTVLLRGTLKYEINGEPLTLCAGDAICLPPTTRRVREAGTQRADFISFNFTLEGELHLPLKMEKAVGNDILLLIAAYDELSRHAHGDTDKKTAHLIACILLILEDRVKEKRYSSLTLKIMEYLHANLSSRITLEAIGEMSFFSPVYCDTVFKRETGSSIIDYLIEERIAQAKRLIAEDVLSLGTIAEKSGFSDYNYFSRVFKKRTGYTPSQYKRITALGE